MQDGHIIPVFMSLSAYFLYKVSGLSVVGLAVVGSAVEASLTDNDSLAVVISRGTDSL